MKLLVQVLRVIVGLLFIFSGLIKANDPLGLAYKMDEYFAVWNWSWASPFSLYLSLGMNLLEIVAGIALLIGWSSGFITKLLLALITFFTFLTGYAVISGNIKSCGCFGDCLPLQPYQSFLKDLLLTAMILVLVKYREFIKPLMPLRANLFLVLFSAGFVFWGQLYVLKHLPYVDCLPYAKGKNLAQQMQPPPGSLPDSVSIFYTYKKNGKEISFDAMNFPADFDEKTYEYVGRDERIVRKGNAEPAIKDFALYTVSASDTTKSLLATKGQYLLFFAKDFDGTLQPWQEVFSKIYLKAKEKNIAIVVLSNQPAVTEQWFNQSNHFAVPVLTCDGTVMKTILRSKIGFVAMDGPVVSAKWSETDMNEVVRYLNN